MNILNFLKKHPLVLFSLITIGIASDYFILGPFSYFRIFDSADCFVADYALLAKNYFTHGVSYWFPYLACGVDRLANNLQYSHLITLLSAVFPTWLAYQTLMVLQVFFASFFAFRLAKDDLNFSYIASLYAGICYGIFCPDPIYNQLGFAGFPFILWAINRISSNPKVWRYLMIVALALFYAMSSSIVTVVPFTMVVSVFWFLIVVKKRDLNFWILFLLFWTVVWSSQATTISAIYLNVAESQRITRGVYYQIDLMSILRSNNKISMALIVIALIVNRCREKQFNSLLAILFIFTFGAGILEIIYENWGQYLGRLSSIQIIRFYEISPFLLTIAGASSLNVLMKQWISQTESTNTISFRKFPYNFVTAVFIGLILSASLIKKDHFFTWISRGNYVANYESKSLMNLQNDNAINIVPYRTATLPLGSIYPSYSQFRGLETPDGHVTLYPKRYLDYWSKVVEPVTKMNEGAYKQINQYGNLMYLVTDYESMKSFRKHIPFKKYFNLDLLSLSNTKYIISQAPLFDSHLILHRPKNLQDQLNWNLLSQLSKIPLIFKFNFQGRNHLYIYENTKVLPRFYFVNKVKAFSTDEKLLSEMAQSRVDDFREILFVAERYLQNIKLNAESSQTTSSISVLSYTPDRINVKVTVNADSFLIGLNTFSPYWKCTVNDNETPILPAYHCFWGVRLDKTAKNVCFYYEPPYRVLNKKQTL